MSFCCTPFEMFLITKFTNVVSHLLTLFFNCVFSAKLLFFVLLPLNNSDSSCLVAHYPKLRRTASGSAAGCSFFVGLKPNRILAKVGHGLLNFQSIAIGGGLSVSVC